MNSDFSSFVPSAEGKGSKRDRLAKLFGRDRKALGETPNSTARDLRDFLRGSSDKLNVVHPVPMLTRFDTSSATRYPNAPKAQEPANLSHNVSLRQPRHSSRAQAKGLAVRFVETAPEVIGQGGAECNVPVIEIAKRKLVCPPVVTAITAPPRPANVDSALARAFPELISNGDSCLTRPMGRTQTGSSTISDAAVPGTHLGREMPVKYLDRLAVNKSEKRKSFIEVQQAEMRQAEGQAFANAVRLSHYEVESRPPLEPGARFELSPEEQVPSTQEFRQPDHFAHVPQEPPSIRAQATTLPSPKPPLIQALPTPLQTVPQPDLPESRVQKAPGLVSPSSPTYSHFFTQAQPQILAALGRPGCSRLSDPDTASLVSPQKPSLNAHDAVNIAVEDAVNIFVGRTRHLFELFRLHSESVKPLIACELEELARGGLWWFLRGRSTLEAAIRERSSDLQFQNRTEAKRQQAYVDLAKGYWLVEEITPEVMSTKQLQVSPMVEESRKSLVSNLGKICCSMMRNGLLPPEEVLLPAHVDKFIWVQYPQISHDLVALLRGATASGLAQSQLHVSSVEVTETFPLGDTATSFCFGRVLIELHLMELGNESQSLQFPCFLSITRPQKQADITFVIASQDGAVQLRLSGNRKLGPVWDDVKWRSDSFSLEIKLPRGFYLVAQCTQADYRLLASTYQFSAKTQTTLCPRKNEHCLFRTTLRSFKYTQSVPQTRRFPPESIAGCEIAVFERLRQEGAAAGLRSFHQGYRIAVVTGPKTKTINGIDQDFSPQMLLQFGFPRDESSGPMLSVKFDTEKLKGAMAMRFGDDSEMMRLHRLLSGTALQSDEHVICEAPLMGVWFSERYGDSSAKSFKTLSNLPWQKLRVIHGKDAEERARSVLAVKLRVVFECGEGTLTDRINVGPGELKLRLDVQNPSCMMVYRNPQSDITVGMLEAKAPRDKADLLTQALEALQKLPTIRTYMFPDVNSLHQFQTALTGFSILHDSIAQSFTITRRHMVIPIHKKWEAGLTRIQLVHQNGMIQLLAFFEDFAHGKCIGFVLKGTDVFEVFGKSNKAGLKIVDAKFPLPKHFGQGDDAQAAAETAFVCLDLPELPGEHDDIAIVFNSEAERDKLVAHLPAPVKALRFGRA